MQCPASQSEPAMLYWHQYVPLVNIHTHTMEDALSRLNGTLLQEQRTVRVLDS